MTSQCRIPQKNPEILQKWANSTAWLKIPHSAENVVRMNRIPRALTICNSCGDRGCFAPIVLGRGFVTVVSLIGFSALMLMDG